MNKKIFGIIGSALISLSILPTVSVFFLIIGYIFLSIALYNTKAFNYFLIGLFFSFLASILFYFKLFAIFSSFVIAIFTQNPLIPITISILIYFLVFYIFNIISAVFFKKAFDLLAIEKNNNYFKYSGYFFVIGAILNIFVIGILISLIGWIFVLVGFFTTNIQKDEIIETEIVEEEKKFLPKN